MYKSVAGLGSRVSGFGLWLWTLGVSGQLRVLGLRVLALQGFGAHGPGVWV